MTYWKTATLGDVLSVVKNGLNCKQNKDGVGQKISRIESIADASFDVGRVGYAELSEKDKSKHRLVPGDILFSHINSVVHVGKTAIFTTDEEVYHGVNLLLMRPTPNLSAEYLELYLKYLFQTSYWRTICKQSVNQASVNQQHIKRVPISFPETLPEQKRIVAILDEAFAGIDAAVANTEKNLANARELFESYLNAVFTQKGDGWVEELLGEIASFSQGKQVGLKEQLTEKKEGYARFVRIVDYTQKTDDIRYVVDPGRKYHATADDIVMVRYGSPGLIGRGINGVIANNLFKINVTRKVVTNDYLTLFLMQKSIQEFLSTRGSSTMPALNFGHVKNIIIKYPSIDIQEQIAEKVELLRNETNRLESVYQDKLDSLAELKQSILQKAFSGELTADFVAEVS